MSVNDALIALIVIALVGGLLIWLGQGGGANR